MGILLAGTVADLSFGGAFLVYLIVFIVSVALATCAVILGAKLRQKKMHRLRAEK